MKKWIYLGFVVVLGSSALGKGTIGSDGTEFVFPDSPQVAEWYNGCLRSFYTSRIDIGPAIFPYEYLELSDSSLNDTHHEWLTAWNQKPSTKRRMRGSFSRPAASRL